MTEAIKDTPANRAVSPTRFEKWQLVLLAAQTAIFFFTFLAAVWIGFRQTEINRQLLDLNFRLSLEVAYDKGRLNIFNKRDRGSDLFIDIVKVI